MNENEGPTELAGVGTALVALEGAGKPNVGWGLACCADFSSLTDEMPLNIFPAGLGGPEDALLKENPELAG